MYFESMNNIKPRRKAPSKRKSSMKMPLLEDVGKSQSGTMNLNQQLASIIFNQHNKQADVSLTKLFFDKCDEYGYEIDNTAEPHRIDVVKRKGSMETSPKLKANQMKLHF